MTDPNAEELKRLRHMEAVLACFGFPDGADLHDGLMIRSDDGHVQLLVQCNDVFWWATADCEEVTPDDLPLLRQTLADLRAVDCTWYLGELFVARKRGMRPQRPWLECETVPDVSALFLAAGPERERATEG